MPMIEMSNLNANVINKARARPTLIVLLCLSLDLGQLRRLGSIESTLIAGVEVKVTKKSKAKLGLVAFAAYDTPAATRTGVVSIFFPRPLTRFQIFRNVGQHLDCSP